MSVDQVTEIARRGDSIFVDLRDLGEHQIQGTISGAVSAPWGTLEFWRELTSAHYQATRVQDGTIVLFCTAGGVAPRAADILQQMGYRGIMFLAGGFAAWKAAGQPVERVRRANGDRFDMDSETAALG
jgi:rhodanese-related sulfurtransferase